MGSHISEGRMPKQTRKQNKDSLNEATKQRWEALRRGKYEEEYREVKFKILERITGDSPVDVGNKDAWDVLFESDEAKELAKKYGLLIAYPPSLPFEELFSGFQEPPPIFKDQEIITIVSPNAAKIEWDSELQLTRVDLSPHLEDGRFLTFRFDMQHTRKEIRGIFEDLLMVYWPRANPDKEERRGKDLDSQCFEIYDLHHKEGMSLLQITRQLFPFILDDDDPDDDDDTKAAYEKVKRAFHKAEALINMASNPTQE
jgi:hypothetical protein